MTRTPKRMLVVFQMPALFLLLHAVFPTSLSLAGTANCSLAVSPEANVVSGQDPLQFTWQIEYGAPPAGVVPTSLPRGDVDGNNQIDETDQGLLWPQWALGMVSGQPGERADLNDDGVVDLRDTVLFSNLFSQAAVISPQIGPVSGGSFTADSTPFTTATPFTLTPLSAGNAATSCSTAEVNFIVPQAATALRSSPAHGAAEVALTRETILNFSRPLAQDTVIDGSVFYAEFGGQRLDGLIHMAPSRDRVTLFYAQPLPASARIRVTFLGDMVNAVDGQAVDADGNGQPGGSALIDFDTLSLTAIPGTRVCGQVFASEQDGGMDVSLTGVTIRVDGLEDTLFALTGADGSFCLEPAPAGRFFVHIDGTTATNGIPLGAYYPNVGKAWHSAVGQQTDVGAIYLPLIVDGTLQTVSTVAATPISFPPEVLASNPGLAGTALTVPPDSLFSDDGGRGGMVGIAPVAPERLPGPLPAGVNFPLVITVQTDGAGNFDIPAPICFPNLPDPVTGELLGPGEKSALWSFNHDTGAFEVVGPMTVNADGSMVCSDEDSGILAPGWHGVQPGTPVQGEANPNPEERDPCDHPSYPGLLAPLADGFQYPQAVRDALQAANGHFQPVNSASVSEDRDVNFDAFSVDIGANEFPPGLSPQDYIRELLLNPNMALNNSDFDGFTQFTRRQGSGPSPSVGDIYDIQIWGPFNDGSVMLTEVNPLSWQFTIVNTPVNGEHPLYGAREFGFEPLPNGDWRFYTRGVSKPANTLFQAVDAIGAFKDRAWTAMMRAIPQELLRRRQGSDPTEAQIEQLNAQHPVPNRDFSRPTDEALPCPPNKTSRGIVNPAPTNPGRLFYRLQYSVTGDVGTVRVLRGLTNQAGMVLETLPPNVYYNLLFYHPERNRCGSRSGYLHQVGIPINLGTVRVEALPGLDADLDGLGDFAEFIIGTGSSNPDSDSDGILDGAEVSQGTNPLDGLPVATGIIASAETPGTAQDVCARNGVAVVADGLSGVAVFNVSNGQNPVIIAQVDTPGNALAVTCTENTIIAADGDAGVALIGISDPPAAQIRAQIALGGRTQAVAVAGNQAYAGSDSGHLAMINLASGTLLSEIFLGAAIQDLGIGNGTLYALTEGRLYSFPLGASRLRIANSVAVSGSTGAGNRRWRLFVGRDVLYTTHTRGYNTYSLAMPLQPQLIADGTTNQFGWKHLVTNGSGLGIAAVSPNSTPDGPHHVSLYDVSDAAQTDVFLTEFPTPGLAAAVSLFKGLAYVADSGAGLQTVNYLAYDSKGVPPTIALHTSFAGDFAEEGQLMRLTAQVTDDVQVRDVVFYVDGQPIAVDGNFPFEAFFTTPLLAQQPSFTIKARATDTGGNFSETSERTITLVPDATPPQVIDAAPVGNARPDTVSLVSASFSEALDENSLTAARFQLFSAGPDQLPGTGDDVPVMGDQVSFSTELRTAFLNLPNPLPIDRYHAVLTADITDLAGNPLPQPFTWEFDVVETTINSVPGGGNWSDVATWEENRLPVPGDVVGIRGIVNTNANLAVAAVLVGPGSVLHIVNGGLSVTDELVNNGRIINPSGYTFRVLGNLQNHGTIEGAIYLSGTDAREIGGNPIEGPVYLDGNFELLGNPVFSGAFFFQSHTLTMNQPDSLGIARPSGTLTVLGDGQVVFTGPGARIDNTVTINGRVRIAQNTVLENPSGYTFRLSRDLHNEGAINGTIYLSGSDARAIIGNPIDGDVFLDGNFALTGNPEMRGRVFFQSHTLTLNAPDSLLLNKPAGTLTVLGGGQIVFAGPSAVINNTTTIHGAVTIANGTVLSNPSGYTFRVSGDIVNNGSVTGALYLNGSGARTISGNAFDGDVFVDGNFTLRGNPIFNGNFYGQSHTLTLNAPDTVNLNKPQGVFTVLGGGPVTLHGAEVQINNTLTLNANLKVAPGTMVSNPSGYSFRIAGDIENLGSLAGNIYLNGAEPRNISGNPIDAEVYINGSFTLTGNPIFNDQVFLQSQSITLAANDTFTAGHLRGTGTLFGGGTVVVRNAIDGHLTGGQVRFEGNPVTISGTTTLNSQVMVAAGSAVLNPSGYTLRISGNIHNEGSIAGFLYLSGGDARAISGNAIDADMFLDGDFTLTGNPVFNGQVYLQSHLLTLDTAQSLTAGQLRGTGTLLGGGTIIVTSAIDSHLTGGKVRFAGNPVTVNGTTTLNSDITVAAGSAVANPSGYTLRISGDLRNDGGMTGILYLSGSGARTISGNAINSQIFIDGSFALSGNPVFTDEVHLQSHSITLAAGASLTAGTLRGTGTLPGPGAVVVTSAIDTNLTGGAVHIAGPAVTVTGTTTLNSEVTVTAGSALVNPSGYTLRISGDISNGGSMSGFLYLSGSGARTISGNPIDSQIFIDGDFTLSGNPVFTDEVHLQSHVVILAAPADSLTTAQLRGTGSILGGAGVHITQAIRSTLTANRVTFSGGGTVTVTGTTQLMADVNLAAGTALENPSGYTFRIGGNIKNHGTWTGTVLLFWPPLSGVASYDFNITANPGSWPPPTNQSSNQVDISSLLTTTRHWRYRGVTGGVPDAWSSVRTINAP